MAKNMQGLWRVSADGGPDMVLWSDGYQHLAKKAVSKYRRMLKKRSSEVCDVAGRLVQCSVEGCYSFATELLDAEQHLINVPPSWRFVGEVEWGNTVKLMTVCPMCEKHARRFRRTLAERVLRLEERLDSLQDDVENTRWNTRWQECD